MIDKESLDKHVKLNKKINYFAKHNVRKEGNIKVLSFLSISLSI